MIYFLLLSGCAGVMSIGVVELIRRTINPKSELMKILFAIIPLILWGCSSVLFPIVYLQRIGTKISGATFLSVVLGLSILHIGYFGWTKYHQGTRFW